MVYILDADLKMCAYRSRSKGSMIRPIIRSVDSHMVHVFVSTVSRSNHILTCSLLVESHRPGPPPELIIIFFFFCKNAPFPKSHRDPPPIVLRIPVVRLQLRHDVVRVIILSRTGCDIDKTPRPLFGRQSYANVGYIVVVQVASGVPPVGLLHSPDRMIWVTARTSDFSVVEIGSFK